MRYLSLSQLSELTGRDRRTVKAKVEFLTPKVEGKAHLYDAREALPILYEVDQTGTIAKQLDEQSLRIEKARAEKIEIEVAKLRGELVAVDDVGRSTDRMFSYVRAQLLSISSRLAKPLASIDQPHEIKAKIDDCISEALSELILDKNYEQHRDATIEPRTEAVERVEENHDPAYQDEPGSVG